jgi:hypothetical protein
MRCFPRSSDFNAESKVKVKIGRLRVKNVPLNVILRSWSSVLNWDWLSRFDPKRRSKKALIYLISQAAHFCEYCGLMITIEDFRTCSFEKKCDVVTRQSTFIASRNMGNCNVYLYHSGVFFIEVFYSPIYKKVLMISAFENSGSLGQYVEKVSLAELGLSVGA